MPRTGKSMDGRGGAPSPTAAAGARPVGAGQLESRGVLVRDTGFEEDDWSGEYIRWSGADRVPDLPENAALEVENSVRAEELAPVLERVVLIRIAFPSHTDGRGFSLARHLRLLGYRGRLRARGQVLADQYAMARRNGFDEVEIDASLAARQPEEQWRYRANWRENDYQARLRARPRRRR